jgi:thiamine-monophosphate kinase
LNITLVGEAPFWNEQACPITRSGAWPGSVLVVTGTLGDSAAGLALLQNEQAVVSSKSRDYLLQRHHEPTARLREVQAALQAAPTSANEIRVLEAGLDLSDGIAGDAAHIARASGVCLEIEAARLPISAACSEAANALGVSPIEWALSGGEDYELLWCVQPQAVVALTQAVQSATGTPLTVVGRCVDGRDEQSPVKIVHPDGRVSIGVKAFEHF